MFSDTITITVDSVAKVLTRVNQDKYSSEYRLRDATTEYRLNLRNSTYADKARGVSVDRHNAEFIVTVLPTVGSLAAATVRKQYFVFENDTNDTLTDPVKSAVGFVGFLTNANLTKMVNFES